MTHVDLGYGRDSFRFSFSEDRYSVLALATTAEVPLSDIQIGAAFDAPIAAPPLDESFQAGDSVLIVVSDITRATASAQIVNLLVRRLIEIGIAPADLAIIFATGIHRPA